MSDGREERLRTMARIDQTDDTLAILAGPIRLTFRWDGRRWSHDVALGGRTLASSIEWEAEHHDPSRLVSPAYQQLSHQSGQEMGSVHALLVGQWGPHHCSGVFTVSEPNGGVTIAVDAALRNRSEIHSWAATYRVALGSSDLIDAGPSSISWETDEPTRGRLCFEADRSAGDGNPSISLGEAGRAATGVQISSTLAGTVGTHRLVYGWTWLPGAG